MALQSDQEFVPSQIARATFPTAFRGYDQDAVRRYLSRLAAELEQQAEYSDLGNLETRTPAHNRVEELEAEIETLNEDIRDLEVELVQRSLSVTGDSADTELDGESTPRGRSNHSNSSGADEALDESRAIEFLGQETARVLESARSAASDILKRAEGQAKAMERQASEHLAEARARAEALVADKQAKIEALVEKLEADAESESAKLRSEASEHHAMVLEESAKIMLEAEESGQAEQQRAQERAREIVADAETLRQQVVAELVAERRSARQELEQMGAARDRVAMSLSVARTELETIAADLERSSLSALQSTLDSPPQANPPSMVVGDEDATAETALETLAEAEKPKVDDEDITALFDQTTSEAEAAEDGSLQPVGEQAEETPVDETVAESGSVEAAAVDAPAKSVGKKTATKAGRSGNNKAKRGQGANKKRKAAAKAAKHRSEAPAASGVTAKTVDLTEDAGFDTGRDQFDEILDDLGIEPVSESGSDPDSDITTELDTVTTSDGEIKTPKIRANQAMTMVDGFTTIDLADETIELRRTDEQDSLVVDDGSTGEVQHSVIVSEPESPDLIITTVTARSATSLLEGNRGDIDLDEPAPGKAPAVFSARDVALARSGADFRRQLRRALNDDQSDVLDRLRAGRRSIETSELPAFGDQIDRYLTPLRRSLGEVAQAGVAAGDHSDLTPRALDNLVRQLAKFIVDQVRIPTIEAVRLAEDDDREKILEPIRAVYRDFRNGALPGLAEDALYEAFAIGLYDSIEPAERLAWLIDPRTDPDPVCEINAATTEVVKGSVFPSGHARPLAMPGCRCLVVSADF